MVRRIAGHFLTTEDVSVGRPRALTSIEVTLILIVILQNPGIYLDEVQRYLEKKPGMVISLQDFTVIGTDKEEDPTPSFVMV